MKTVDWNNINTDWKKIQQFTRDVQSIRWLKRFCETKIGNRILEKAVELKIKKYSKRW